MRSPKWFYLNGKLHRRAAVNRPADLISAWCFRDEQINTYILSDVHKRMQKAFGQRQTAKMINRNPHYIHRIMDEGKFRPPERSYNINTQATAGTLRGAAGGRYYWSEDDVLRLHDYFLNTHIGKPRNDGLVTPGKMPNKTQLRALMKNQEVLYVKGMDGEFYPVWKEVDWTQ